ncbi:hypothetical protein C5B78_01095 [Aeromonas salmonicida]|nr:hypothetical protein C5B78_01095 [Aeromonas salmonicida]
MKSSTLFLLKCKQSKKKKKSAKLSWMPLLKLHLLTFLKICAKQFLLALLVLLMLKRQLKLKKKALAPFSRLFKLLLTGKSSL